MLCPQKCKKKKKIQQLVIKQNLKIYFELQTWYGLESKVLTYVCTTGGWFVHCFAHRWRWLPGPRRSSLEADAGPSARQSPLGVDSVTPGNRFHASDPTRSQPSLIQNFLCDCTGPQARIQGAAAPPPPSKRRNLIRALVCKM